MASLSEFSRCNMIASEIPSSRIRRLISLAGLLAGSFLQGAMNGPAAVFIVSNANDAGNGSLREAIIDANSAPGRDEIRFGSGFFPKILLSSALPEITDPVTIDGTSAPSWFFAPVVKLDGQWSFSGNGLTIQASDCVIKGLDIRRFNGAGIWIGGGSSNIVQRCWFGVDTDGWAYNRWGVVVSGRYNLIGGTTRFAGNWISGNTAANLWVRGIGSSHNEVRGNVIGPDLSGQFAAANQSIGVLIDSGATDNTIGGIEAGSGNVISGMPSSGLLVHGANTLIQGNWIGLDYYGQGPLGNGAGCRVVGLGSGTVIGGNNPAARNIIAHSVGAGVVVKDATNVAVVGNSIYGNAGLEIDLGGDGVTRNDLRDRDEGSNRLQNFPVVNTAAGDGRVSGVLTSAPNERFQIEFFNSASCDTAGNGEGQISCGRLEVVTGTNGVANISAVVSFNPGHHFVSATATDETGNTSEFSPCTVIANTAPRFTKGPDQVVKSDVGVQTIDRWATGIAPGGAGEALQSISFLVTNDSPTLFLTQPEINELGTLRFTPAPRASGSAMISVALQDDGGTANGGQDTSDVQTFLITILRINGAPLAFADFLARGIVESNELQLTIIAGYRTDVLLIADASHSSDPDGDPLVYEWFEDSKEDPFATGVRATNLLSVGIHDVSLRVSDGVLSDSAARIIKVISMSEAVRSLIQQVKESDLSDRRKHALVAVIQAGLAQIDRGRYRAGRALLVVAERYIEFTIGRLSPRTAQLLLSKLRPILHALEPHNSTSAPEPPYLRWRRMKGEVTLDWPISNGRFLLEQKVVGERRDDPWRAVPNAVESNSTHFLFKIPAASTHTFFRLRTR